MGRRDIEGFDMTLLDILTPEEQDGALEYIRNTIEFNKLRNNPLNREQQERLIKRIKMMYKEMEKRE